MATFLQDLKYGARLLAKAPGFTVIAALSLALGIGANTTIFTLINAVLLNPLPVEDPSQLVSEWTTDERNQGGQLGFLQLSPMTYKYLRDKNDVFTGLAAHQAFPLTIAVNGGEPQQVLGKFATGNYFSLLGAKPAIGRTFTTDDDRNPGERLVAVLGYGEWQKRFGGEPSVVGRTMTVNGQSFAVIGVMPKGFKGTNAIGAPALWVPYMTYPVTTNGFFGELIAPNQRRGLIFNVTGRLKPGVTVQQAEANLKTIARQLAQEYPNENGGPRVTIVPFLQADAVDLHPDVRVLLFTIGVSFVTGIVFGLAPAVQASRPDLVVELKEKTGAPAGANRMFSLRNMLVAAQIALSLVALIGAGLFLRSLQNAQRINPGFDADHLAVMSFDLGAQGYTEERGRQFQQRVLERAGSVPA